MMKKREVQAVLAREGVAGKAPAESGSQEFSTENKELAGIRIDLREYSPSRTARGLVDAVQIPGGPRL
jgi:hypothetical protein